MQINQTLLRHLIETETDPYRKAALERDWATRFGAESPPPPPPPGVASS